jgi:hypothetical protein
MKNTLIAAILLSFISFISMFFYFLATTDIYHDYVSKKVVSRGLLGNVGELPDWTNCKLEWGVLQIDLVIRIIFMILVTILLVILVINNDKQKVQYR